VLGTDHLIEFILGHGKSIILIKNLLKFLVENSD